MDPVEFVGNCLSSERNQIIEKFPNIDVLSDQFLFPYVSLDQLYLHTNLVQNGGRVFSIISDRKEPSNNTV